ncbi:hypothetical protein DsansV1_C31g0216361 [Dioscorea sansibarensis]
MQALLVNGTCPLARHQKGPNLFLMNNAITNRGQNYILACVHDFEKIETVRDELPPADTMQCSGREGA